jgi:hypothetical protein
VQGDRLFAGQQEVGAKLARGQPGAGGGDGNQDADAAPKPLPVAPATPSTAALRSVGHHDFGMVDEAVDHASRWALLSPLTGPRRSVPCGGFAPRGPKHALCEGCQSVTVRYGVGLVRRRGEWRG